MYALNIWCNKFNVPKLIRGIQITSKAFNVAFNSQLK